MWKPVYHVETPRPFMSPPPQTLFGHVTELFTGTFQDFSESCDFPIKNPIKVTIYGKGVISQGG